MVTPCVAPVTTLKLGISADKDPALPAGVTLDESSGAQLQIASCTGARYRILERLYGILFKGLPGLTGFIYGDFAMACMDLL